MPPRGVPRTNPAPLYAQIKDALRGRILDGTYQHHERIPSESELTREFSVSRITVQKALGDLEHERLIFRVAGKGSYVTKPTPVQSLARLQGFAEAMASQGFEILNRLISVKTVASSAEVAERLHVETGSPVSEIRRVRLLNREPVSLDVSYLTTSLGERLAREDLVTRDIFLILENDYDIPLGHADLRIDATSADAGLARHLRVAPGAPILRIERLTHTAAGDPLDYEHLYYRGDGFRYHLRIDRNPA